jgi:hypothetical protein
MSFKEQFFDDFMLGPLAAAPTSIIYNFLEASDAGLIAVFRTEVENGDIFQIDLILCDVLGFD